MRVVLISTYELGRQPFGLASPAAWLRAAGAGVTCVDLSRETLPEDAVRAADLVAFYVPMHTATRLAVAALPAVRGAECESASLFLWFVCSGERELFARIGRGDDSWRGIRGGIAFTCGEAGRREPGGGEKWTG